MRPDGEILTSKGRLRFVVFHARIMVESFFYWRQHLTDFSHNSWTCIFGGSLAEVAHFQSDPGLGMVGAMNLCFAFHVLLCFVDSWNAFGTFSLSWFDLKHFSGAIVLLLLGLATIACFDVLLECHFFVAGTVNILRFASQSVQVFWPPGMNVVFTWCFASHKGCSTQCATERFMCNRYQARMSYFHGPWWFASHRFLRVMDWTFPVLRLYQTGMS